MLHSAQPVEAVLHRLKRAGRCHELSRPAAERVACGDPQSRSSNPNACSIPWLIASATDPPTLTTVRLRLASARMVLLHPSSTTLSLATPPTASSSTSPPPARPLKHQASLTDLLAAAPPSTSPQKIFRSRKYLPKPNLAQRLWVRFVTDGGTGVERKRGQWSAERRSEERERVRGAGSWPQRGDEGTPTDLFLDVSTAQALSPLLSAGADDQGRGVRRPGSRETARVGTRESGAGGRAHAGLPSASWAPRHTRVPSKVSVRRDIPPDLTGRLDRRPSGSRRRWSRTSASSGCETGTGLVLVRQLARPHSSLARLVAGLDVDKLIASSIQKSFALA